MEQQEISEELREFLTKEGYSNLKIIPGRGVCGLMGFAYTIGLVYGIDMHGYEGRWCYPRDVAIYAVLAINTWNGEGDPPFDWVKFKGHTEYSNPKLPQDEF